MNTDPSGKLKILVPGVFAPQEESILRKAKKDCPYFTSLAVPTAQNATVHTMNTRSVPYEE